MAGAPRFILALFSLVCLCGADLLCPSDIAPCSCYGGATNESFYVDITCNGADFETADQLKSKLSQPFSNNPWLYLYLDNITFPLPQDLLGSKNVRSLYITCWDSEHSLSPIHPLAFQGARLEGTFTFNNCNLTETGFEFMASFPYIDSMKLIAVTMKQFVNFPTNVPSLNSVELLETTLQEWYPAASTPNLTKVILTFVGKDNTINIMRGLADSPKLEYLDVAMNDLDVVPEELKSLTKLKYLYLGSNPLGVLPAGSFHLPYALEYLILENGDIVQIESDAFSGNFSNTIISVAYNQLSTLDETVFQPLLSSMAQLQGRGFIDVDGNYLTCGCDLKWLVQDNRQLLPYLRYPICANGTYVEELDPDDFNSCPADAANQEILCNSEASLEANGCSNPVKREHARTANKQWVRNRQPIKRWNQAQRRGLDASKWQYVKPLTRG